MSWQERCDELVAQATSAESLFSFAVLAIQELGFEHGIYHLRGRWPVAHPLAYCIDTAGGTMQLIDEQLRHAHLRPLTPVLGNSTTLTVWPLHGRAHSRTHQILQSQGVVAGWTAMMYRRNAVHGTFSAFRREGISELERRVREADWICLAETIDAGMRRFKEVEILPSTQLQVLTEVECEVLRWAAEGQTAWKTGQIMGLTERMVNYHRTQAQEKMEAGNITEAACKALAHGLLAKPASL